MTTILIVDDHRSTADMLARITAKAGYKTLAAYSGEGGLEILSLEEIDLLITDLIMPDLSGLALIGCARGINRLPPTILVTAYDSSAARTVFNQLCKEVRHDYLIKPIGPEKLLDAIKLCLQPKLLLEQPK